MAGAIRSKKIGSCFEWLELSIKKKIGSRSNGWSYTFQKSCELFELDVRGKRLAICFETVAYNSFGRDVSSRDPVKVNSLRTAISQEYIGQTKVSLEQKNKDHSGRPIKARDRTTLVCLEAAATFFQ